MIKNSESVDRTIAQAKAIFEKMWAESPGDNKMHALKWFVLGYAWQQKRLDAIEADVVKLMTMIEELMK